MAHTLGSAPAETESVSKGRVECFPETDTRTAECFIGHTRNWSEFLGWNWAVRTMDGNLYLKCASFSS